MANDVGSALYFQLSKNSGVTSLCAKRIQPQQTKQESVWPQIVYEFKTIDVERTYNDGRGGVNTDRVKVHSVGRTSTEAAALAKAVFECLDDADSDETSDGTWDGLVVRGCFMEDSDQTTATMGEAGQELTVYIHTNEFDLVYVDPSLFD